MSSVERDCARVLQASASAAALSLAIVSTVSRPWASALFVGHRLNVSIRADDHDRLDDWLIALPEQELTWRGHFVASAEIVTRGANAATVELLVVES